MAVQQDIIKRFVKSLDESETYGIAALDEAVNYASSGLYADWDALVSAFVSDVSLHGGDGASTNRTLNSKTAAFLKEYCGIVLTNTDTGAITGYDAGGSATQISAEDIIPEDTTTEAVYPPTATTVFNGVTVVWPSEDTLTDREKEIVAALYSWWLQPAFDLVEKSIGISYREGDVRSHTLTITFDRTATSTLADANLYNINIYTQAFENIDISGGEHSGKRSRGVYFDRILAHELTHAVMSANENELLWDNSPVCVDEGIAEFVHGVDDSRKGEIVRLAQAANAETLRKAMYYTRSSSEDKYDCYAGGYMLFRYLAKQVSEKVFTGTAVVDLNSAAASGVFTVTTTATGKAQATFTTASVPNGRTQVGTVTALGKYAAVERIAQAINASKSSRGWSIKGGSGEDTITGSNYNDTLTGGGGTDVFIYTGGNDVVTDYSEGEDSISVSGGVTDSKLSGSDVILTTDGGTIKVKDGASKAITVNGTASVYGVPVGLTYNAAGTVATLNNAFNGTLNAGDYYSTVKTITAASRTKAVNITGNALANVIRGSKGGDTLRGGTGKDSLYGNAGNDSLSGDAGNDYLNGGAGDDTLRGGAGNDSLTGGAGSDVFIYSGGNDTITDYSVGVDSIRLSSGSVTNSSISGSDVILCVGSGSITVKNAKGKAITLTDAYGTTSKPYQDTMRLILDNTTPVSVTVGSDILTADASARTKAIKITGNALANTIQGGSGNDTLYGNNGNDSLNGGGGSDSLNGGSGNDTLSGGKGNDTLTGGLGRDVFLHTAGNDVITDYTAGQDTIRLASGSVTASSLRGSHVVLTTTSGTVTVRNAKGKAITVTDNGGTSTKTYTNAATNAYAEWFIEDSVGLAGAADELAPILREGDFCSASSSLDCSLNFNDFNGNIQGCGNVKPGYTSPTESHSK